VWIEFCCLTTVVEFGVFASVSFMVSGTKLTMNTELERTRQEQLQGLARCHVE
jgi:hypothetical protein